MARVTRSQFELDPPLMVKSGTRWREQLVRIIGLALCASILLFYWLIEHSDKVSIFNVFRYITFRTGAAILTAVVFMLLFSTLIRFRRARYDRP
jgi:hypothetical protein